jgi:organic radical activating enzyme
MTIAVETNGTIAAPAGIDWICVSPKAGISLAQCHGHELKLVYPQPGAEPGKYDHLDFDYFFLQPMDGNNRNENMQKAIDYVLHHPHWRISLQLQKIMHVI